MATRNTSDAGGRGPRFAVYGILVSLVAVAAATYFAGPQRYAPVPAPSPPVAQAPAPPTPEPAAAPPAEAALSDDVRRTEQVFQVGAFGRFAVAAATPYGAAIQLVDRMAGPGAVDGVVGARDGRIDGFLGPGAHKLRLQLPARAEGEPDIRVTPFAELNAGPPLALPEFQTLSTSLGDMQQRSYWIEIPARRSVFIEAAGRHLGDLRLWKDGTWLVDAVPVADETTPTAGQPLTVRRLVADLAPGAYRLTAYGGPGRPWTEAGAEQPLHLRFGIPTLPATARRPMVAGPFGYDRWLVKPEANFFHLELPAVAPAALSVVRYAEGQPLPGERAVIDKTSRAADADVSVAADGRTAALVTVERAPGEPYVLQHHVSQVAYTFDGTGTYLVSTVTPASADGPDVTTALVETKDGRDQVVADSAIRLGKASAWRRTFNVLGTVTLFLNVADPGRYQLSMRGVPVDAQVAPFLLNGRVPLAARPLDGNAWDLEAGYYELTLAPARDGLGVLDLTVKGAAAGPGEPEPVAARLGATFAAVPLATAARYRLFLGLTGTPGLGAVVKALPLDLDDELPLALDGMAQMAVEVRLAAAATVAVVDGHGAAVAVSADGGAAVDQVPLAAGPHRLVVANPGAGARQVYLRRTPPPPTAAVAAPLAHDPLAGRPTLTALEADHPLALDLARKESRTFLLTVDKPAIYRVETTGLLETNGAVGTQVQPDIAHAAADGIGRNFLLQRYLREGVYQLTVATQGATAGHLGVAVAASPVRGGGALTVGEPARVRLDSGEGVAYTFDVAARATYRVQALALAGATTIRLEDGDGWPLTTPAQTGDLTTPLDPGRYRLVVLPQALPARIVTLVEATPTARPLRGHGPHPLPLDATQAHRWEEPAPGAERVPDVWTFHLDGPAAVTFTLGEAMLGTLTRADGVVVAAIAAPKPTTLPLDSGDYRLAVRSQRPDNRFDYTVKTAVRQLTAGRARTVTVPAVLPLSVGRDGLVELASFGPTAVRAWLVDAQGADVAHGDDQPGDWNFALAARLAPGAYWLKVEPVGEASGATTVRMSQATEVADAALSVPALADSARRTVDDAAVHVVPLTLPADGTLLVAQARAAAAVGLAVERETAPGLWQGVGAAHGTAPHVAVARDPAAKIAYRLRLWPLDHRPTPVALTVRAVVPAVVGERQAAEGVALAAIADHPGGAGPSFDPPLAALDLRLDRPGLVRIDGQAAPLEVATAADRGSARSPAAVVVAGGDRVWLLGPAGARATVRRVTDVPLPPLVVPAGEMPALALTGDDHGPVLWVVDSRVGQPGAALGTATALDGRTSGVAAGSAAAVSPDAPARGAALRLWRADGEAGDLPVTLRRVAFADRTVGPLGWGVADVAVAAGGAHDFGLPAGLKRLRLALPPHMAAALVEGGAVQRTIWSGDLPLAETVDTAASRLLLLEAGGAAGQVSLMTTPAEAGSDCGAAFGRGGGACPPTMRLTRGKLAQWWQPTAGTLRLEVAADGAPMVLTVTGAGGDATVVQRDGAVRTGTRLPVTADATVMVRHGPGLVAAWLDGADDHAWPAAAAPAAPSVPGTVALSGPELAWTVAATQPELLHLVTSGPVLTGARPPGAGADIRAWPQGAALNLFTPQGATVVGLRPLSDGPLTGTARLAATAPLPLAEGLGPKLRLAPGEARLFAFTLAEARTIGVGVHGSADSARMVVYDASGAVVARGVSAMPALAAGTYYLMVENRADAPAVEIRPALVGTTRPDTGPPEDIKRAYWQSVSEEKAPGHE